MDRFLRPLPALILIGALTLAARLLCLPLVREDNLTPDGARFLNLARCIERGQGFSTPEAWPAWMNPQRLPMPETFKEPGYPYAIAALTPLTRDPFRAAQGLSLLAGLLVPFAVYALARRLSPDPWVALLAGLLAAASPVLMVQSTYVMAESCFALALALAFLAAAPPLDPAGARFAPAAAAGAGDFLAGAWFGMAFLVRAQGALALPALVALLLAARTPRVRAARLALAALGTLIALAPLMARNLRLFGTPLHSDVAAFGLWPYVDQFALTHSLEPPPPALGYALAHPHAVTRHFAHGLVHLLHFTLPHDLLGHWLWLPPLAVGAWIAARRARVWGFAFLYLLPTAAFILSLNWVARYFASAAPLLCLLVALGAVAIGRRINAFAFVRRFGAWVWAPALMVVALLIAGQVMRTAIHAAPDFTPELAAARHEAAFLRAHLEPGEAVMAEVTSYWAWFADRPAVHPVVADSARFTGVMRRLRVRYAALPSSRLAEFASRYPGGHLPAALVRDHEDAARDVTVFEVRVAP